MRHPLDGNAIAADAHYDRHEIGHEDGQPCLRIAEPCEDMPRPRKIPCEGTMIKAFAFEEGVACDTCGEIAE